MSTTTKPETQDDGLDDLEQRVEALEMADEAEVILRGIVSELQVARKEAANAYDMAYQTTKDNKAMEKRLDELQAENERLHDELEKVETLTEMLSDASEDNRNIVEKRAVRLIETLFNKAWRNKEKNNEKARPVASADYNKAEFALGADLARTQIYAVFDRAEELVGDRDVCKKIAEDRSSEKNTRLVLDLSETDRLTVDGTTITPNGGR